MDNQVEKREQTAFEKAKHVFRIHVTRTKEKDKKAWIINAVIAAVIILGIIGAKNASENRYADNLKETQQLMFESSEDSEYMVSEYSSEWSTAIDIDYDFDLALQDQYNEFEDEGDIDNIEDYRDEVKARMVELQDPPSKFEAAHAELLEMYGSYKTYSELSMVPDGSLLTYNEKTQTLKEKIDESSDKIDALIQQ
jgi:hypothetical protein